LSQLPIGVPGPEALAIELSRLRARERATPLNPNKTMLGRVLDERGNPYIIMDDAEKWRLEMAKRLQKRIDDRVDPKWIGGTHRTTPIPPVQWENGVEVFDDALVKVYASRNELSESKKPVEDARAAMKLSTDARAAMKLSTDASSADLARAVAKISESDGDNVLGWWAFVSKLREAVPALTLGAMWIVGAAYSYYLLLEQVQAEVGDEVPWGQSSFHPFNPPSIMSSYEKPRAVRARVKGSVHAL